MKRLMRFPAMVFGLFLLLAGTTQSAKAQYDDVSLQTFYDELSPYGTWINDAEYGYVWRPDVDQGEFRPYYTNGRWVMTEYGNTWVSNYDWGWAPFHYGRWIYNRYNRWVWIPDTTWGPAWVSWRSGGGYYGWAPLAPSISININFGPRYVVPDFCWNFIPERHIYYTSYPRYYSGRNRVYIQNTVIINNTYVRNNRTYYTGPRADDIRRATNRNVTVYNVSRVNSRNSGNRIENNTVNIYSPRPTRGVDNAKAAPREVVSGDINRGRVDRGSDSRGRDNGNYNVNNERGERYSRGNVDDSNISRGRDNNNVPNRESRVNDDNRSADRGSVFGRSRNNSMNRDNNVNRGGNPTEQRVTPPATQERVESSRPTFPSRSQRSQENTQPSAPPQRVERMDRMERQQPQQPQRVERAERPQSSGSNSRSNEGGGRASRGESSGRPGRG
ncbi:DUF6600 domain-containing protein [Nubsella zeaxanthinifaciens]|uniref:DUF6600 domain-containing protein n=1 Tax=Nubsella zeaxanthinifaciens TaxID=392412 RepID=UPI003D005941